MNFDVLTLFPDMFRSPLSESILQKAQERGLIRIRLHDLRGFTHDRHRQVDDAPYGGGGGMVLMPGPIFEGVESILSQHPAERTRIILLSPQGPRFDQAKARQLFADHDRLLLICGRYEGVDERVRELLVDEEVSIGDYVLTGGELAAMVIVDAVSRLVPGVLGDQRAAERDSFGQGGLEHPQYTRPAEFRGHRVPEVLLSGDHAKIADWRHQRARHNTLSKRPDLLGDTDRIRENAAGRGNGELR